MKRSPSTKWLMPALLAVVISAATATPVSAFFKTEEVIRRPVHNAPVTATYYLRDIHTVVGTSNVTYNTVNTTKGGTLSTAVCWTGTTGYFLLADAGNHSIFASTAVPNGRTWTLTGNWTYAAYINGASAGVGTVFARVFRIRTDGAADLIATSNNATAADAMTGAYIAANWTAPITNAVLKPGERFGIEYVLKVTTLSDAAATLGLNGTGGTGSPDSYVRLTYNDDPLVYAAYVRQNHFRIGNDDLLTSMTWRGYIDQTAPHIRRDTNYRARFQVYNDGIYTDNWSPRLDWSTNISSNYTAVPVVSGSAPFFINDTADYANGATIATANFSLGTGNGTAVAGIAYDTVNPPSGNITLAAYSYTEVEFNFKANTNATYNGTYYFRLSNNGTALDAYDIPAAALRIQLAPSASDPHNSYTATTDKCAVCHRTHTGKTQFLRKTTVSEQALCFSCHNGTGATTNIQAQFSENYTSPNANQHPVALKEFWHNPDEIASANFTGTSRHVECEDCHKPHSRFPGLHDDGNNAASLMIDTSSGVRVTNTSNWTAPTYTFVNPIAYEYELCFKCHSSWAYSSTPPLSPSGFWGSTGTIITANETNQAMEFNTLNRSHHAVEAPGRNQPPVWANPNWPNNGLGLSNNFVSPWTAASTVQCNDCHSRNVRTEPDGPHGSTTRWALRQNETGTGTATNFCYNCHSRDVYGDIDVAGGYAYDTVTYKHAWSRFPHRWYLIANSSHRGATQNRWGIWCMTCHAGDSLGGTHGTDRRVGTSGTGIVGDHFLNGAVVAGWTSGNTTNNSGIMYTKGSTDAVNSSSCSTHSSGSNSVFSFTYNY